MKHVAAVLLLAATLGAMPSTPAGFANANRPWTFAFPRDHAAHPAFASEWWYYTGHLRAAGGRRFGYELTFFRIGLRPGVAAAVPGQSRWRGNQLYLAHLALTDEQGGAFFHTERVARDALRMGYASTTALAVGNSGWTLRGPAPFRLQADAGEVALDLTATSEKPPAIHGHDGISRKAACATCASHYYSMTRLRTGGTLRYRGARFAVDGLSWMDHEFGSDELQADQVGWDWFSLQLDDRRELMLYVLRRTDGSITPASSGSVIERDGRVMPLARDAFVVDATGAWTSPHTGARYPSGWRVRVAAAGIDVRLRPTVLDQELAGGTGGISYWEGAVDVSDSATQRPLGAGYVELTGYAGAIAL